MTEPADKPEEKKTVEIVAPSPTEIAITELRRDLKTYTAMVEKAIESQGDLVTRVSNIEERQKNTSDRVRGVSESDLKQDAAIAEEIAKRLASEQAAAEREAALNKRIADAHAVNVALATATTEAKAFFARPGVRYAIGAIWSAILVYAATHYGVHLAP